MPDVKKPNIEDGGHRPPFTLGDVVAVVGILLFMMVLAVLVWIAAMMSWTAQ